MTMLGRFRLRVVLPFGALALAMLLGGCYYGPYYPGYGYYGGGYYAPPYYGGGYYAAPYYGRGVVAYGGGWGWHDGSHDYSSER